ncbi:nitrile hydratase accessory protein [Nitratireductor sp. CAU 1489]|uniref:Nitrile hydratase accessory protein n=1 Tax=Nitratireductor arenosus TaxID=2682096 RepID=A0A844QD66_9HYPH|nr:nitrile hydratase accessory protein [Nitratireductor arenosus]MVA97202.1 nitrile hydratase accessory protein [Nitratireductor arenosus]
MSGEENSFAEPWQAQAFALALALQDKGLVSPGEWAAALGRERARVGVAADGSDYYHGVVAALEALLAEKGLADHARLAELAAAWHRAARATPHGAPILLENDPVGQHG